MWESKLMLQSGRVILMSISSAMMAKSASGYLSQGSQYLEWSIAEKKEQSSGVYSVRTDLPQFLLFPPLPQNMYRISIWAYTEHQYPCILPTKCTSNGKYKLLVVYSCYDRCHQLAQLHVIFKGLVPPRQAGEQVSSLEKSGCAACFGLGKCTRWEGGWGKALPLFLWLKLWGRTCLQSHFWGQLVPAPCHCAPPECSHPLHFSLQVLLSSQGSKIDAKVTSPKLWPDLRAVQASCREEEMHLAFSSCWALAAQALPSGQNWSLRAEGQMRVPPAVWSAPVRLAHLRD